MGGAASGGDLTEMMSQQSKDGPEQVCGSRWFQGGGEVGTGALRWGHLWTAS